MNLSLKFRDRLYDIGQWFVQELDQLVFAIRTTWDVEHNDDGTHGDIHATSLTVRKGTPQEIAQGIKSGNIDTDANVSANGTGVFGGDVTAQNLQSTFKTRIGLVGSINANDGWIGAGTNGASVWTWGVASANPIDRRFAITDVPAGMTPFLVRRDVGGNYYIQPGPVSRGAGMLAWLGNPNDSFHGGWWDGVYSNAFYRNFATVAEGDWQSVAYAAGNFTASAGTWGVDAPDQSVFRYTLIGKTMIVVFQILQTDVSNAGVSLRIAIPGGFTCATTTRHLITSVDAGGAAVVGLAIITAAATFIECFATVAGGGFGITAGDNTAVIGVATFEVQ